MEKAEIIFSIIIVLAYIILSIILNIPLYAHLMFGSIILFVLFIVLILKCQQKYENEKMSKIFKIISVIILIGYFITLTYESFYNKPLFIDSTIFLVSFFATLVVSWVFKKNSENKS